MLGYLRASLSNFHKMPSNVCLWCCYFCRWATFVICLMTYMNEIALLGFFLHVKCWYRMFCVALFFEIHLTSAYFGRNLSFDIFFLISMEPFWIESTVSPEIVCIMFFRIYITLFLKGKNFCIYIANPVLVCIRNIQNINLLNFLHYLNTMLFEDLL